MPYTATSHGSLEWVRLEETSVRMSQARLQRSPSLSAFTVLLQDRYVYDVVACHLYITFPFALLY